MTADRRDEAADRRTDRHEAKVVFERERAHYQKVSSGVCVECGGPIGPSGWCLSLWCDGDDRCDCGGCIRGQAALRLG